MPAIDVEPTLTTYYEDDYFGEPWLAPEPVLLVHGVAESSRAWFAWVPHLARTLRVLRPDLRGFGRSTIPPAGYAWSPAAFAIDLARFLDALALDSVHVVGAKLGGSIALQLAADHPAHVRSLTIVSSPVRARSEGGTDLGRFADSVATGGVRAWAAETQRARLGSAVPQAQIEWWTDFMAASDPRVVGEVTAAAGRLDVTAALPRVQVPALVITTEKSALQSVATVREWAAQMPNAEVLVLPGDSYHVAAAQPDECAQRVLAFIRGPGG